MTMLKKSFALIGYGVLLWIILGLVQLVISMFTASYETIDVWWANLIAALFLTLFSWLFSRSLHPANTKQALIHGVVLTGILVVIHLILIIPNGFESMFGHIGTYFLFIGTMIGPLLGKKNAVPS